MFHFILMTSEDLDQLVSQACMPISTDPKDWRFEIENEYCDEAEDKFLIFSLKDGTELSAIPFSITQNGRNICLVGAGTILAEDLVSPEEDLYELILFLKDLGMEKV